MDQESREIMSEAEFEDEPLPVEDGWEGFRDEDAEPVGIEQLKSLDLAHMPKTLPFG